MHFHKGRGGGGGSLSLSSRCLSRGRCVCKLAAGLSRQKQDYSAIKRLLSSGGYHCCRLSVMDSMLPSYFSLVQSICVTPINECFTTVRDYCRMSLRIVVLPSCPLWNLWYGFCVGQNN